MLGEMSTEKTQTSIDELLLRTADSVVGDFRALDDEQQQGRGSRTAATLSRVTRWKAQSQLKLPLYNTTGNERNNRDKRQARGINYHQDELP
jgi:hypothetical protein